MTALAKLVVALHSQGHHNLKSCTCKIYHCHLYHPQYVLTFLLGILHHVGVYPLCLLIPSSTHREAAENRCCLGVNRFNRSCLAIQDVVAGYHGVSLVLQQEPEVCEAGAPAGKCGRVAEREAIVQDGFSWQALTEGGPHIECWGWDGRGIGECAEERHGPFGTYKLFSQPIQ